MVKTSNPAARCRLKKLTYEVWGRLMHLGMGHSCFAQAFATDVLEFTGDLLQRG